MQAFVIEFSEVTRTRRKMLRKTLSGISEGTTGQTIEGTIQVKFEKIP